MARRECRDCNGTGVSPAALPDMRDLENRCGRCNGRGTLPEARVLQQTGRTTRAVEAAVAEAAAGRYVFLICADGKEVERLTKLAKDRALEEGIEYRNAGATPKLYVGRGQISFETPHARFWNWSTCSFPFSHRSCVYVVDHYAVEKHLQKALTELHRFDPED